ncbi:hypothetical protein ACLB2K_053095 [Fragaria x ananassa]
MFLSAFRRSSLGFGRFCLAASMLCCFSFQFSLSVLTESWSSAVNGEKQKRVEVLQRVNVMRGKWETDKGPKRQHLATL